LLVGEALKIRGLFTFWAYRVTRVKTNGMERHGDSGSKAGGGRSPIVRWSILVVRTKAVWLGDVEAASETEAIAKGAAEFNQPKERLMAVRRG
jgi:hypothetical protein